MRIHDPKAKFGPSAVGAETNCKRRTISIALIRACAYEGGGATNKKGGTTKAPPMSFMWTSDLMESATPCGLTDQATSLMRSDSLGSNAPRNSDLRSFFSGAEAV